MTIESALRARVGYGSLEDDERAGDFERAVGGAGFVAVGVLGPDADVPGARGQVRERLGETAAVPVAARAVELHVVRVGPDDVVHHAIVVGAAVFDLEQGEIEGLVGVAPRSAARTRAEPAVFPFVEVPMFTMHRRGRVGPRGLEPEPAERRVERVAHGHVHQLLEAPIRVRLARGLGPREALRQRAEHQVRVGDVVVAGLVDGTRDGGEPPLEGAVAVAGPPVQIRTAEVTAVCWIRAGWRPRRPATA